MTGERDKQNQNRADRRHAFISYSHHDQPAVRSLHRQMIRSFQPWWRRSDLDLFRDEEDLLAGGELSDQLREELDRSENLVLAVSPASGRSSYVDQEVDHWLSTRGVDNLIPVVIDADGELSDVDWSGDLIPQSARGRLTDPLAVDMRHLATGRRLLPSSTGGQREAMAGLVAKIDPRRSKQELIGQERRRRRGNLLTVLAVALVLIVGGSGLVLALRSSGESQRDRQSVELATAALAEAQPDLAYLLAAEAFRVSPTAEAEAALGELLSGAPGAQGYLRLADTPLVSIASSNDGGALRFVTEDGQLITWDLPSGQLSATPTDETVLAAAFTATLVVLATEDEVQLRDLTDPTTVIDRYDIESTEIAAADNGTIAVATADGAVLVLLADGDRFAEHARHTGPVTDITVTDDGRFVATAGEDGNATVVEVATSETTVLSSNLGIGDNPLSAIALSEDGAVLAAASLQRRVALWDVASEAQTAVALEQALGRIDSMVLSPDGRYIVAGGSLGSVAAWDVDREELIPWSNAAHDAAVGGVAHVRGTTLFASIDDSGTVAIWDILGRNALAQSLNGRDDVAFETASSTLVTVIETGVVQATSLSSSTGWSWSDPGGQPANHVALVPDGHVLVSLADGALVGVDLESGLETMRSQLFDGESVLALEVDGTAATAYAISLAGELVAFDPSDFTVAWRTDLAGPGLYQVTVAPSGDLVVTGGRDVAVQTLSASAGEPIDAEEVSAFLVGNVTEIAFATNTDTVARVTTEGLLLIGEPSDETRIVAELTPGSLVQRIAISPGGRLVALMTFTGEVAIWDAGSGRQLVPFRRVHLFAGGVPDLHFADDDLLFSVDGSGLLGWEIQPETWATIACLRAARPLYTSEERALGLDTGLTERCARSGASVISEWFVAAPLLDAGLDTFALQEWATDFEIGSVIAEIDNITLELLDVAALPIAEQEAFCAELTDDERLTAARAAFLDAPSLQISLTGGKVVSGLVRAVDSCLSGDIDATIGAVSVAFDDRRQLGDELVGSGVIRLDQ